MATFSYLASEHFGFVVAVILAIMFVCGILLRRSGKSDRFRFAIYFIELLLLAILFSFICIKDEQMKHVEEDKCASFSDHPSKFFTYEYKYVSDL